MFAQSQLNALVFSEKIVMHFILINFSLSLQQEHQVQD